MMAAMMLPSIAPVLWRYKRAVGRAGNVRPAWLTAHVAAGYLLVWTVAGLGVFVATAGIAAICMRLPWTTAAAPFAIAALVVIAGAMQFTRWKDRHLACWRKAPACSGMLSADAGTAWRCGLRLGAECGCCCGNLMAILVAVGMMDLPAMALVTAAITVERLAPAGEHVARAIGAIAISAGLLLIVRAAGLA